MKSNTNIILRVISALVLGLVLILWPDAALNYLVITVGIIFLVVGLFGLISFWTRNRERSPDARFPLDATGSAIFGLILALMPEVFVSILMFVLGALLIISGIVEIASLVTVRKWSSVPLAFYIMPVLITLAGLIVLFNPFKTVATTLIIVGIASLVYGISELINYTKFTKRINQ